MEDLTDRAIYHHRAMVHGRNAAAASNFLTVAEIALSMRVSKMTVYRLIQSGALESIRFGRSYRVSEASVQQYLESVNAAPRM